MPRASRAPSQAVRASVLALLTCIALLVLAFFACVPNLVQPACPAAGGVWQSAGDSEHLHAIDDSARAASQLEVPGDELPRTRRW